MLILAANHTSTVLFILGYHSTLPTAPHFPAPLIPSVFHFWSLWPGFLVPYACQTNLSGGHVTKAVATGCIGSTLDCPAARGICPHICLTVDGKGTDPRRSSPLNALALLSMTPQQDSNPAFHATASTEMWRKLPPNAPENNQFLYLPKLSGYFGVFHKL